MARLARVIVADCPHHVTRRGNRREPIFFEDADQDVYHGLLAEQARKRGVEVWAYCLMPNHVHLIVVPSDERGLGLAVGEAHRRYTNVINARGRRSGHLFQSRFASVAMDEAHLIAAARYVPMNPVRHASSPIRRIGPDRAPAPTSPARTMALSPQGHYSNEWAISPASWPMTRIPRPSVRSARLKTTGRPLGAEAFIEGLERLLGRKLARGRPGPAPKSMMDSEQPDLLSPSLLSPYSTETRGIDGTIPFQK
jgi:putative transposase